jgi:hypothetical protein
MSLPVQHAVEIKLILENISNKLELIMIMGDPHAEELKEAIIML